MVDSEDPLLLRPRRRPSAAAMLPRVVLVLVAVQAVFGGNFVVMKMAVAPSSTQPPLDPIVLSFFRDVGGGALLLLACWCTGQLVRPQQSDIGWFVLIGIAGIFVGQMFAVIALKFISPLNAALSQPLQPILTAILASCLGLDALRLRTAAGAATVAGILLAVAGGAVAVVGDAAAKGSDEPHAVGDLVIGNALLLTQCLCGAGYQCVQKHVLNSKAYPALAVAAWGYVFGGAMVALVLPIASYENAAFWTLPRSSWLPIAYAILLTSAFNYGAQAWANRHSSPTTVTAFFPLQIGFAALFQWVFLGAPPSPPEYVGAALTILGLALMVLARRRVAVAAAEAESDSPSS